MVKQNFIESLLSTAASVVNDAISFTQSIISIFIDSMLVFLQQVYEILSILIKSIYDFGMAIANDPVVRYATRTLIAEPIIAAAKFIGTVYLGAYAFITNEAMKYYLFVTYLMPVIEYFDSIWRSIVILFYVLFTNIIRSALWFVIVWPFE